MMDKKVLKSAEVLFDLAYAEDIGDGDITTNNLVPLDSSKKARLVAKEKGIVAGLPVAEMVFKKFDKNIEWDVKIPDGSKVKLEEVIKGKPTVLYINERWGTYR